MATGDAEYEQIDHRGIAPTPTHRLAFEGGPFVSVSMGEADGLVVLVSGAEGGSDEYTGPVRLNVNSGQVFPPPARSDLSLLPLGQRVQVGAWQTYQKMPGGMWMRRSAKGTWISDEQLAELLRTKLKTELAATRGVSAASNE